MTQQCVIYKRSNGNIAVLAPTAEALQVFTIQEIAVKDVPTGSPFKILDESELPNYPTETWVVDDTDLDDGVGE